MEEALKAIGTAIKLIVGAAWYLIVMLPLAGLAFIIGIILIPADLIVLLFSMGQIKFQIFYSFMHAAEKSLSWYADTMT